MTPMFVFLIELESGGVCEMNQKSVMNEAHQIIPELFLNTGTKCTFSYSQINIWR